MFFTIFYTLPVIINIIALYKEEKEYMDKYGKTELTNGQILVAIVCFLIPVVNLFILFLSTLPYLLPKYFEPLSKWLDTSFTSKK